MKDEVGLEKDSLGLWAGGRRWKWVIAPRQGAVARSGWFLGRVEGPEWVRTSPGVPYDIRIRLRTVCRRRTHASSVDAGRRGRRRRSLWREERRAGTSGARSSRLMAEMWGRSPNRGRALAEKDQGWTSGRASFLRSWRLPATAIISRELCVFEQNGQKLPSPLPRPPASLFFLLPPPTTSSPPSAGHPLH